jgi:NitT/TauT family transport system permease protein
MGGSRRQVIQKVVLPSALAWVFAGLKISVPHALTGAVVGELFASNKGLGSLLAASSGQFDTAGVFAVIIVLTILGIIINEVVNRSEGVFMRWRLVDR